MARTAEEQREAIEAVRRKNILEHQMREERERGAQGDREQGSEAPQTQEGVGEETQEGVTSSVEMAPAVGNLS